MNSDSEHTPWGSQAQSPITAKRAGMLVDLRRCIGCHSCSISCKTEHEVPLGNFRTRVHYAPREETPNKAPSIAFVPMLCMHCEDAPCIPACPTSALLKLDDGRVIVDDDACNGTKACVKACPYDAISINPATNKAEKCDFCEGRTAVGMEPACVESCPTTALRFGDLDDPKDPMVIEAKKNKAKAYKEKENTKPNVLYIGHEQWMEDKARGVQRHDGEAGIVYE